MATAFSPGAGSPPAGDGGEGREAGLGAGSGTNPLYFFILNPSGNLLFLEVVAAVAIGPLVPSYSLLVVDLMDSSNTAQN